MSKNDEVWMSQSELLSLSEQVKERALTAEVKKVSEDPSKAKKVKLSITKLNLMLLTAAEHGDKTAARQALSDGAAPNARARSSPGRTPFTLAIEHGHDELALELLRLGSWPQPRSYPTEHSEAFDKAVATGNFKGAVGDAAATKAMSLFANHAKSFKVFQGVRDWCNPSMSDSELLGLSVSSERYNQVIDAVSNGYEVTREVWVAAEKRLALHHCGLMQHPHRKELLALIAMPLVVKKITKEACEFLYKSVVTGDDLELMSVMLQAGLRPNKEWSVSIRSVYNRSTADVKHSLILLAAASDRPALFDVLKVCPPLLAALKANTVSPDVFLPIPIGRLMELSEAGVDLEGCDQNGLRLPHLWALKDGEPRDGWATLAKKMPTLFNMKDPQGRTGADMMASKLSGIAKDAFLASLSRIESREIKSEIGPKEKTKLAPVRLRL